MEIKLINNYSAFLKGKKESLLVNPSEDFLKKNKNNKSRILLFTSKEFNGIGFIEDKLMVMGAGEYEIGGVEITGTDIEGGNTIYSILIDGISVLILGKLENKLSEKLTEKINNVDVLLAPIEIGEEMSFKIIKEYTKKWGVNYLIPMGDDKEALKEFLDGADEEGIEESELIRVEKESLPDGLELKLLKIV